MFLFYNFPQAVVIQNQRLTSPRICPLSKTFCFPVPSTILYRIRPNCQHLPLLRLALDRWPLSFVRESRTNLTRNWEIVEAVGWNNNGKSSRFPISEIWTWIWSRLQNNITSNRHAKWIRSGYASPLRLGNCWRTRVGKVLTILLKFESSCFESQFLLCLCWTIHIVLARDRQTQRTFHTFFTDEKLNLIFSIPWAFWIRGRWLEATWGVDLRTRVKEGRKGAFQGLPGLTSLVTISNVSSIIGPVALSVSPWLCKSGEKKKRTRKPAQPQGRTSFSFLSFIPLLPQTLVWRKTFPRKFFPLLNRDSFNLGLCSFNINPASPIICIDETPSLQMIF